MALAPSGWEVGFHQQRWCCAAGQAVPVQGWNRTVMVSREVKVGFLGPGKISMSLPGGAPEILITAPSTSSRAFHSPQSVSTWAPVQQALCL